ncbi:hypothetical protein QYF61_027121 [Mycteria americana]|uniref:Uncharacterized protein n=1 Tax=Mycteria americana TaxID=33587 RepID=A0AAN7PFS2_MYCAM|nr:hypothetical protein QYF61_027121 [Mycteria americana]
MEVNGGADTHLQPVEVNGGADIHLQPVEEPMPEQWQLIRAEVCWRDTDAHNVALSRSWPQTFRFPNPSALQLLIPELNLQGREIHGQEQGPWCRAMNSRVESQLLFMKKKEKCCFIHGLSTTVGDGILDCMDLGLDQAKQSQFPQPLLIRLVLQTLHQLRCPSLDTLQHLNVSLVVGGPKLNTVFEVRPHQCRVQGHDHFPAPAGHTIPDTSQDAIGFLGHVGTLLADTQPAIDQHPQVRFHWAPFQPLFPKPVALHEPFYPQADNTPTQLGVICKFTEGALDPLVQIIDKDMKQNWPQHRALGDTTCDRPPTGVNSIHHNSLGPAIQPVFYPGKGTVNQSPKQARPLRKSEVTVLLTPLLTSPGIKNFPFVMTMPKTASSCHMTHKSFSVHKQEAKNHRITESQNHRIIEWFWLEGTFKGHPVQSPCNEQGHLQLDQVAQSPIQPDLDCLQGWGIHHLSGKPVPVFHHPHLLKGRNKVCTEPSFLQDEETQLFQPFFIGEAVHPSNHFCGPPLDPLQQVYVFPVLETPELDTVLQGTVGFLGFERTLSAHVQLFIQQYSQVLLCRATFNPFIFQSVLILGVALTHVQDLALGLVEPHKVHMGPLLQLVQVSLDGISSLRCVNCTTQLGVICKLAEGALNPTVYVIDEAIKQ